MRIDHFTANYMKEDNMDTCFTHINIQNSANFSAALASAYTNVTTFLTNNNGYVLSSLNYMGKDDV